MDQEKDAERRAKERFSIHFKVSIFDIGEAGRHFLEESELHDVSGDGLSFLSHSPQMYQVGQRLHVSIVLPGTDRVDARLEGNATVAWVNPSPEAMVSVGLAMDDPLDFISGTHRLHQPEHGA